MKASTVEVATSRESQENRRGYARSREEDVNRKRSARSREEDVNLRRSAISLTYTRTVEACDERAVNYVRIVAVAR